ncbi:MAG: DUF6377 domain-containing protein [Dysgonamonadaceae bacterium]|jgi:hypothetical protein|nr:DUF6377 domain-containing protein [Dysgonamonadaceae bacterium]
MKRIALSALILLSCSCYADNKQDDILKRLDQTITQHQVFQYQKEQQIEALKLQLNEHPLSLEKRYNINKSICNAYYYFQCDSAIRYTEENLEIALRSGKKTLIDETNMQLAGFFSTIGMYKEANELLSAINPDSLDQWHKIFFYNKQKELYKNLSYNNFYEKYYRELSDRYRDSLLLVIHPSEFQYRIVYAEKLTDAERLSDAKSILLELLDTSVINHELAQVAYSIARVYSKEGNTEMKNRYYALSAIADIENSVMENVSLQLLALSLYESGDVRRAYRYIDYSLKDAIFCNAYIRTVAISKIYPIIEASFNEGINKQKTQLTFFLIITGLLSFFLILAVVYLYVQIKKVIRTRKEISLVNSQLQELNLQLQTSNNNLLEANLLKEAYIGRFLDVCSNYIDKLDDFRRTLNKKASDHKFDELSKILKSKDIIEKEIAVLYHNFDTTFLHLFPSFIDDFNALLLPKERFVLKSDELMNVEMRIFALIRLGITDSSKIASFLRYSNQTIYNYRSRIKTKALVPREEFEKMIMKIGFQIKVRHR